MMSIHDVLMPDPTPGSSQRCCIDQRFGRPAGDGAGEEPALDARLPQGHRHLRAARRGPGLNIVDSSAWLEYFADGPNAAFFAPALEDSAKLIVPTITIVEVYRRVCQQRGEAAALDAISLMQTGEIVNLDLAIATLAGRLGIELHLPLADSILLATARARSATFWTQDADFAGIEGVRYRAKV